MKQMFRESIRMQAAISWTKLFFVIKPNQLLHSLHFYSTARQAERLRCDFELKWREICCDAMATVNF